jgi:hypothetical protein
MTASQHYIVHTITIVAIVILSSIILSPSKAVKNDEGMITLLEHQKSTLIKENDYIKVVSHRRLMRIDSIKKSIAVIKPENKQLNNKVDEIKHNDVTDSVITILTNRILARDTN